MNIKPIAIALLLGMFSLRGQTKSCSCCTDNHTLFDFWVGKWEVTDVNGAKVGSNTIKKLEDGCVLQEKWVSADGKTTGTSLNFYNQNTDKWEQLWVDNSGSYLKLTGTFEENKMTLSSDGFMHSDVNTYVNRITWTNNNDGTVRQLWEVLDGDKVVFALFDGLYTRTE